MIKANQRYMRSRMTEAERAATPEVDFSPFMIADADTGHGGDPHVRNLVRRFVEVGVPRYHIEDQRPGTKKCGHQGGKVLVSCDEQIKRLNAARFQLDVMGVAGIIVARTDAEAATLLDNRGDERDQPFILGSTNVRLPTYKAAVLSVLRRLHDRGIDVNGHLLYAVSEVEYADAFGWLDRSGVASAIDDVIEAGDSVDVVVNAATVSSVNFITYGGHQIDGIAGEEFSAALREDGMLALARLQRKFRLVDSPYKTPQSLVGGPRLDGALAASSGRTATTKAMGKGSTQFQHLVQTEIPPKRLEGWLSRWAEHYSLDQRLRVQLRPHRAGAELLELLVLDHADHTRRQRDLRHHPRPPGAADPQRARPEHLRPGVAQEAADDPGPPVPGPPVPGRRGAQWSTRCAPPSSSTPRARPCTR